LNSIDDDDVDDDDDIDDDDDDDVQGDLRRMWHEPFRAISQQSTKYLDV